MTFAVRLAQDEDLDRVAHLVAHAYLTDGLIEEGHPYLGELRDASRRADQATVLVAVEDRAVLGTVTLAPAGSAYAEIARPGEVEIRMLAVDPVARGRGVGEALVRAAAGHGPADDVEAVVLTTLRAMRAAQRMYVRLGFERDPARDWSVGDTELLVYRIAADRLRDGSRDAAARGVVEPPLASGPVLPSGAGPSGPGRPGLEVEVATWSPIEVVDLDGWSVGLSAGFTRRANSVVARGVPPDADAVLEHAEALYSAHHLPPVVRVCADSRPDGLDGILERRGYRVVAPTLVMVAAVDGAGSGAPTTREGVVTSTREPDVAWLRGWLDVKTSTAGEVDLAVAREILCGSQAVYLAYEDAGGVAGVLRAAFVGGWVGLSCLTVAPRARRRGVGRALTTAALDLARRHGADRAFLQVEASNTNAVALYEGLGFAVADRYHYRQR